MKQTVLKTKISFAHAFRGLRHAFKTQLNFRIHLLISLAVIVLAVLLDISRWEAAILTFAIVLGLAVEMMNTAIEEVTDLVTKEWRQEAKIAKDAAAGVMLITALGTASVGLIIFLPRITAFLIK